LNIYAESSAVLAWLLGEPDGERARLVLDDAEQIVASQLTLVECDRVLIRSVALGLKNEAEAADRHARLEAAATGWTILGLGSELIGRARQPFPGEPVRTLDALHLASALAARQAVAGLALLSLDDRLRAVARRLGFALAPHDA